MLRQIVQDGVLNVRDSRCCPLLWCHIVCGVRSGLTTKLTYPPRRARWSATKRNNEPRTTERNSGGRVRCSAGVRCRYAERRQRRSISHHASGTLPRRAPRGTRTPDARTSADDAQRIQASAAGRTAKRAAVSVGKNMSVARHLTHKLTHSRRKRASPAMMMFTFHKPVNCPAGRLLRAASGSEIFACDTARAQRLQTEQQ